MAIYDRSPRALTQAELSLLQEVTARSWAHVERVAATAELRRSEARLRAVFDQAAAGFARTDLSGRFIEVNDHYCTIVRRSREELLNLRMQDITHPHDLTVNQPLFEAARAGGPSFDIEKRYLRPDGSAIWVRNSVSAVREGEALGSMLAVSVDISDRKRAQDQLQESETRLRGLNQTLESQVAERTARPNVGHVARPYACGRLRRCVPPGQPGMDVSSRLRHG